jgi:putative transposase
VEYLREQHPLSIRQACDAVRLSQSVYYYRCDNNGDEEVIGMLTQVAEKHRTWGFWKMYRWIRKQGWSWNHKRVYRVYTTMKLNIRRKCKRRVPGRIKQALTLPIAPNIIWSMDFMQDRLMNGAAFRVLNIIDDYNREVLTITSDRSISSGRVIRELDKLLEWRGKPEQIRVDNGPEFLAHSMELWCEEHGIILKFIQPGKPSQNAYVERFNRTYRQEVLNQYLFEDINQVKEFSHQWMWEYNNERPHDSLQDLTPVEFLLKYGKRSAFPTFQQDNNNHNEKKFLISNAPD